MCEHLGRVGGGSCAVADGLMPCEDSATYSDGHTIGHTGLGGNSSGRRVRSIAHCNTHDSDIDATVTARMAATIAAMPTQTSRCEYAGFTVVPI